MMKAVAIVAITVALSGALAVLWGRHTWLQRARRLADARIEGNRAKRRPGMERMDEKMRDRTMARRKRDDAAIENFVRELRSERGRVRIQRAS